MTEEKREIQVIPELKAVPAEELLDTTYAPSGTLIDGLMGQGIYILCCSLVYLNPDPQFFSKLNEVWDILI